MITNEDIIDEARSTIRRAQRDLKDQRYALKAAVSKLNALPEKEAEGEINDLEVEMNRCDLIIEACQS